MAPRSGASLAVLSLTGLSPFPGPLTLFCKSSYHLVTHFLHTCLYINLTLLALLLSKRIVIVNIFFICK